LFSLVYQQFLFRSAKKSACHGLADPLQSPPKTWPMMPLPCSPPPENRQQRPDFFMEISFPQRLFNPANPAVLRAEPISSAPTASPPPRSKTSAQGDADEETDNGNTKGKLP
jgi:hypothetical protein